MKTYKILIVEDEKPLREILRDKFQQEKFDVLEAKDGQEGLEMAMKESPDIILLDIVMPVMDGMTMARKIREAERKRNILVGNQIPIIFLTNLGDEGHQTSGQKEGIYNYLIKSNWPIESVVKQVKDKLEI
jgi:two-component system, OmpR family, response regulator ResD